MGCASSSRMTPSRHFHKTNQTPNKGETVVMRHPNSKDGIPDKTDDGFATIQEIIKNSSKKFSNKPFLGTREKLESGKFGGYKFLTYGEAFKLAQSFGSGLLNLNLVPEIKEYKDYSLRMFGVYSKNNAYWGITDLANALYGLTTVPIYDTLGEEAVTYVFDVTNLTTVVISKQHLKGILKAHNEKKTGKMANLVIMEESLTEEDRQLISGAGLKGFSFAEVVQSGEKEQQMFPDITAEHIYTLCYTSGTTGVPKGAMLSHRNLVSTVAGIEQRIPLSQNDVHLSFLPMPHVLERAFWVISIHKGITVGFYGGDPRALKEDIQALRPTVFLGVPRVYNIFYSAIKGQFDALTGAKKALAQTAISTKLSNLKNSGALTHLLYDKLIFKKVREGFGGRIRFFMTGSAPMSPEVMDFLKIAFSVPMYEGYGQTENSAGCFATYAEDNEAGGVGGPFPHVEYKLIDVPELNYLTTDKDEHGKPVPRGEILTRGPSVFKGYYRQEEQTNEILDSEGFLHSGDIGKIDSRTGKLFIIDRRKALFKLAQGEYIAPEKLQNAYQRAEGISEIFVYGDSFQPYLVSIIIPNPAVIKKMADELKLTQQEVPELCKLKEIKDRMLKGLNTVADSEKFNPLERIKKIHICTKAPSFNDLELTTATLKIKRNDAAKYFAAEIKALYEEK